MTKPVSDCAGCSHYGSADCPNRSAPRSTDCAQFLSWSDQLFQESIAIEKAQRVAWALLLATSVLAALVVLLPELST